MRYSHAWTPSTLLLGCLALGACEPSPAPEVLDAATADQLRITRHLRGVEADLRTTDVSSLDSSQREHRAAGLDRLHQYWLAGVYPQNHDPRFSERAPLFFDAEGRACAVADLVVDSGHGELAHTVETRENDAYLRDMTTPGLLDWADAHGFSAAELGRIQPSYCGCGNFGTDPVCGEDGRSYENACVAEQCAGVAIEHEGVCEPSDEDPDGWPEPPITAEDIDVDADQPIGRDGCSITGGGASGLAGLLALLGLGGLLGRRRSRS